MNPKEKNVFTPIVTLDSVIIKALGSYTFEWTFEYMDTPGSIATLADGTTPMQYTNPGSSRKLKMSKDSIPKTDNLILFVKISDSVGDLKGEASRNLYFVFDGTLSVTCSSDPANLESTNSRRRRRLQSTETISNGSPIYISISNNGGVEELKSCFTKAIITPTATGIPIPPVPLGESTSYMETSLLVKENASVTIRITCFDTNGV